MTTSPTTVLLAGGGTAGHVFPALAVARALVEHPADIVPVFVGTADRLEGRLVPEAGFELHHIDALPLPRRPSAALLRLPGALRSSISDCSDIIDRTGAAVVASFGGYVGFPLSAAARRTGTPLVVHEQNSVPGFANRVAARWAERVAVSFPGSSEAFARRERVVVTGNPVREEILAIGPDPDPREARAQVQLDPSRRTLLVFGGSQGARTLNDAAVASYPAWQNSDTLQILHASGEELYDETAAAWKIARAQHDGPAVRCVDFIDDMAAAYAAADVVVCRAGATSVAELTVVGRASVLVPYPHATADHQRHNAAALARIGAARMILDRDLTGPQLVEAVQPLLDDDDARARTAAAARLFGRRDAAANVARVIVGLASRHGEDAHERT